MTACMTVSGSSTSSEVSVIASHAGGVPAMSVLKINVLPM